MPNKYQKYKDGLLDANESEAITRELIRRTVGDQNRKRWADQLANEHQVQRNVPKTGSILRLRRSILLVAACLLAIVLAFNFWPKAESVQQLAQTYLEEAPFPNALVVKGEPSIDDLRQRIADAYNLKQYNTAISLSQRILDQKGEQAEDLFFLGLSYLYQGEQAAAAIPHLERVVQLKGEFAQESQWFLALAYVKDQQDNAARDLLEEIVSKAQWPGKNAQVLLDRLDE